MAMNENKSAAVQQEPIFIKRHFNLSNNNMWKAWSDPETFKKWWGPKNYSCPTATVDFKVGGKYLSCMRGPDGKEFWSTGSYKEIIPERKIMFSDSFSDSKGNPISAKDAGMPGGWPNEATITIELTSVGEKTNLILTHEGIPAAMKDECTKGWLESLDKLEKISLIGRSS